MRTILNFEYGLVSLDGADENASIAVENILVSGSLSPIHLASARDLHTLRLCIGNESDEPNTDVGLLGTNLSCMPLLANLKLAVNNWVASRIRPDVFGAISPTMFIPRL